MAFKPGHSGNPRGLNGVVRKVDKARATCRRAGPELMEELIKLAKAEDTPPAVRVSATKEIMDRGYGKPNQSVEIADSRAPAPREMSNAEREAAIAAGRAEIARIEAQIAELRGVIAGGVVSPGTGTLTVQ